MEFFLRAQDTERTLLMKADSVGRTPLHWVAKNDRADMAHELLIRGAAKNAKVHLVRRDLATEARIFPGRV